MRIPLTGKNKKIKKEYEKNKYIIQVQKFALTVQITIQINYLMNTLWIETLGSMRGGEKEIKM